MRSKQGEGFPTRRAEPLRIVSIGGGTGLSTLLKGLKHYTPHVDQQPLSPPVEITAVVTVTDDGGSSGRLRREFDILPPGDIRNCMVALSEDEALAYVDRRFQQIMSGTTQLGTGFTVSEAVVNGAALEGVDPVTDNASVLVSVRVTVADIDGVNKPSMPYRLRVIVHEDDSGRMTGYDIKYPDGGN